MIQCDGCTGTRAPVWLSELRGKQQAWCEVCLVGFLQAAPRGVPFTMKAIA